MKKIIKIGLLLILLVIVVLFKVYLYRKIPQPEFNVERVELLQSKWNKKDSLITLTLSTKENFIQLYKDADAVNIYLYCPLTTNDFLEKDTKKDVFSIGGFLRKDTVVNIGNRYFYTFPISFEDRNSNNINKIISLELLKDKDCVDCIVVMAFFALTNFAKQDYKKFCIPKDSLIKFLK